MQAIIVSRPRLSGAPDEDKWDPPRADLRTKTIDMDDGIGNISIKWMICFSESS